MSRSFPIRAVFLTALAPMLWSTGGIGIRILDCSAITVLFWRSLFTTATLIVWSLIRYRSKTIHSFSVGITRGWPVAFFFALSFIFYVFSVTNTSVADSLLIQGTSPIFIAIIGWIVIRDIPEKITIAALGFVIIGIGIIMFQSLENGGLSGNLYGLLKALSFASGVVAIRGLRNINHLPATAIAGFLAMVFALFLGPDLMIDLQSLAVLAYLGTVQVGIGFILFVTWSGYLKASQTGLIVILEAVFGPIWPWIWMGEKPGGATFVGGAVIIGALVLHSLYVVSPAVDEASTSLKSR